MDLKKTACLIAGMALIALNAAAYGFEPVEVSYRLPAEGELPQTYRVTLAITLKDDPNWIISTFVAGEARTVTEENGGRFTEQWDGLDENYMPVPPGEYGVKGIFMPAEKWRMDDQYHTLTAQLHSGPFSWLPRPDQDDQPRIVHGDPVGSPPGTVATAPGGRAVFYWIYLENGTNNFLVDLNKPIGLEQIVRGHGSWGAGGGVWTCTDGENLWSHSGDGGTPFIYRGDGKAFGSQRARFRNNVFLPEGAVAGMAALRIEEADKTLVYVAQRGRIDFESYERHNQTRQRAVENPDVRLNRIQVLDGDTAEVLATIPIEEPISITITNDRLYALHRQGGEVRISGQRLQNGMPADRWQQTITVSGVERPSDITVDSRGRIYLTEPSANQVYRIDSRGNVAHRFGRLDAQIPGQYDKLTFMAPTRLAAWTDEEGNDRIIVVESQGPARFAEWSPEGELIREWQTIQPAGNNGYAVDPMYPRHVYIPGVNDSNHWFTRFNVDYDTGEWTVDAVWPNINAGMHTGWAPHGKGYPKISRVGGRTYLTFGRGYSVYRLDGDQLVPSAGIIKHQEGNRTEYYVWRDRSGNGTIEEEEWRDQPLASPGGVYSYWGGDWQDDLSLVVPVGRELWRLAPDGFDEHGNPIYSEWKHVLTDPVLQARARGMADAYRGGNEAFDSLNSSWWSVLGTPESGYMTNLRFGGFSSNHGQQQKISRYVPDGEGGYDMVWRIGRSANIREGNGAIVGSIKMSPIIHNMFAVVDQTRAGCYVFTEDGLYVDTLLLDASHTRRTIYGSGGEFFAGDVFLNRLNGKVYIAWGKLTPIFFEVKGWTADAGIQRLTDLQQSVRLTARNIADPPERALQIRGGAGRAKVAALLPAVGTPPELDGSMTGWEACEAIIYGEGQDQVSVRAMYDMQNIYLRWHIRSETAIEAQPLHPADRIFTHDRHADTMSFYIQADLEAHGKAVGGRPGDARFVFGVFEDGGVERSVALGMYPKWTGRGRATPTTYMSPVGQVDFEHVSLIPQIRTNHKMDADAKGFVLTAAIPRSVLPAIMPEFSDGLRTMVNFETTFRGSKKLWWSYGDGSASRETNDEPSEARLYPGSWAPATFSGLADGLILRQWQVVGPFGFAELPNHDHRSGRGNICRVLADTSYPPEESIDLTAAYTGEITQTRRSTRTVQWAPVAITEDTINFRDTVRNWQAYEDEGAIYIATWVHSPEPAAVRVVATGGHGHHAIRGWLNKEALPVELNNRRHADLVHRIKQDEVMLQAGWNELLVRFDFIWGHPVLGVRLAAPSDTLWNLQVQGTPPAER